MYSDISVYGNNFLTLLHSFVKLGHLKLQTGHLFTQLDKLLILKLRGQLNLSLGLLEVCLLALELY